LEHGFAIDHDVRTRIIKKIFKEYFIKFILLFIVYYYNYYYNRVNIYSTTTSTYIIKKRGIHDPALILKNHNYFITTRFSVMVSSPQASLAKYTPLDTFTARASFPFQVILYDPAYL